MPQIESKHVQTGLSPVAIAYIGNKEIKKDTLCRTGVVWYGQFDVQAVDPVPASRLLKFPSVWIREDQLEEYLGNIEESLSNDSDDEQEHDQAADTSNDDSAEDEDEDSSSDAKKIEDIQTVITSLDQENSDHFTSNGKPKVKAIQARMPDVEISAADVAEAFSALEGS